MTARRIEAVAPVPLAGERSRRAADFIDHVFLADIGYDAKTMVLRLPRSHHLMGHNICPIVGCDLLSAPYVGQLCATCYARWKRVRTDPGMSFDVFADLPRDNSNRRPDSALEVPLFDLSPYPAQMREQLLALISLQRNSGRRGLSVLIRSMLSWIDRWQITSLDDPRFVQDVNGEIQGGRGGQQQFRKIALAELHLALTRPEDEKVKDYWNLRVFGYSLGFLNFRGGHQHPQSRLPVPEITQRWLRETAKEFTYSAMLPQHLAAGSMQAHLRSVAHISATLSLRDDRGEDPSSLSHADIEAFLIRLNRHASAGTISNQDHFRYVVQARRFVDDVFGLGLDQPGQPAAGLAPGFRFRHVDRVRLVRTAPEDEVAGEALPDVVMEQLLSKESLAIAASCTIAGEQASRMIQVIADVGRRPGEVTALAFNCLDYEDTVDEAGQSHRSPVLIYDMPKTKWVGRRLPIHASTAAIIESQQDHVRELFPDTPGKELALWPRLNRNPRGIRRITSTYLTQVISRWMKAIPQLQGPDVDQAGRPIPFDHDRVFAYAFRHTFAQRHADNGTPLEVLKELMGHEEVTSTQGYYQVTAKRKREAIRIVAPFQLDRKGTRTRPGLQQLVATEHTREAVGSLSIPFGVCIEPSNVRSRGRSCSFRYQCLGCTHFRTDPSYLPELREYLSRRLSDLEILRASTDEIEDWAAEAATPRDEEIEATRNLIRTCEQQLSEMTLNERSAVDAAIQQMRASRGSLDDVLPPSAAAGSSQPSPVLFPTIQIRSQENAWMG